VSRIVWSERSTPAANAARQLPQLMAGYFAGVRKALGANPAPAEMHKIRLASKKVRYTLELFEQCYGAGYDQRMQALKDVQTYLGDVNDAVSVERMLSGVMPRSVRRKALRAYMKKRAAERAGEFRVHWIEQFDADGEERRWIEFLKKPRGATRRAKRVKPVKSAPAA
jgi:CHAD domain-containing protein